VKTNHALGNLSKASVFSALVFLLVLFGNVEADERAPQQPSNTGKYQAIYAGEDKAGYHILLIVNTETGKIEKRIFYDEANDKQEVLNYITKEITEISRREEKTYQIGR
jgi:hypothetical protein